MGIELVKHLYARHAAGLTAGELTVLGYMCITALDKPNGKGQPAGLYFAGWEPLALALGYDGLSAAGKEKVRRSIKGVREKGLIKPLVAHAKTGERQVYRITFAVEPGARNPSPTRATGSEPQEGHNFRGDWGTDSEPPRKDSGRTEDLPQDITLNHSPQVQDARGLKSSDEEEGLIEAHAFRGQPGDDCATCGGSHLNRRIHPLHLIREAKHA